jgi:putative transposase
MLETMIEETKTITCKYCQSDNLIKFGTHEGIQRFYCKDCNRKFVNNGAIPKMQNSTKTIADAVNMYYEGMSERKIRNNLIQQDQNYVGTGTIYRWVNRFTDLAVKEADKQTPKVGDTWIADETYIRIDKSKANVKNPYSKSRSAKWIVFWDIIDADTRFLLASHIATTRGTKDAQILMEKAAKKAGKTPKVVVTDKLGAYLDGIELAYGSETKHKQGAPFDIENNTNLIERFHGSLKDRTKVMRALKNKDTLEKFMDGWLVHYNYFRPHMSLSGKTPAEEAGIDFPFKNWKDVTEQPYQVTARIENKPRLPRMNILNTHVSNRPPKVRTVKARWVAPHKTRNGGGLTRRSDR